MITEAKSVGNALLGYPFRVSMNGMSPFYVQKCKLPNVEFEVIEVNGGGQTLAVKQVGGEKVTEWTIEGIMGATGEVRTFLEERRKLQRTRDSNQYYFDVTVTLLGPNDEPNHIWDIEDAWFSKPQEWDEFDASDKKKLATWKATLQCNDCNLRVK